jgi:3D (Asp-Asp-Asp) domain-containing protein
MSEKPQSEPPGQTDKAKPKLIQINMAGLFLCAVVIAAIPSSFGNSRQTLEAESLPASFSIKQEINVPSSFHKNTLLAISKTSSPARPKTIISVVATAYSSTTWQTDDTPFITAAGTPVREGIVAANFLPFGTEIKMPEIYGDKVFVVEDRMNPRVNYRHIDIWFPSLEQATGFGAKRIQIEILEKG